MIARRPQDRVRSGGLGARLEERVQGAVERADAMFRTSVAPWPIIHL